MWVLQNSGVVEEIIFDRIVDVGHFRDVEAILLLIVEIFLQFQP